MQTGSTMRLLITYYILAASYNSFFQMMKIDVLPKMKKEDKLSVTLQKYYYSIVLESLKIIALYIYIYIYINTSIDVICLAFLNYNSTGNGYLLRAFAIKRLIILIILALHYYK